MSLNKPIFLEPIFQERIWGGTTLKDNFGYSIPSDTTGECWAISAHPNGESIVSNGAYEGLSLNELWNEHRELFGNQIGDKFPLLTKILDANKDLSVQVHPDDDYANENENGELGKTECWYIIDCKADAEIVYGHNATTKEEISHFVGNGEWNKFLRRIKIKPGDFFYVPSGTIHALCEGTLVLETQQSSDTTYRVYDYDRVDQSGVKRELHLEKAIEVTTVPHVDYEVDTLVETISDAKITRFVQEKFFTVYKWDIAGNAMFKQDKDFMLMSVLGGNGKMTIGNESYSIKKGDHFILPFGLGEFDLNGELEMIVSHN